MELRLAVPEDSAALLSVYAQYIDTPVTFECALPSEAEFAGRIRSIGAEYPYLVCREAGQPVGYAYAHRQMERAAYQWNAELSVYLDRGFTSRGLGTRLYRTLLELLRLQGIKNVYAGVTMPNEKSRRLHQSMGFRMLGIYRSTGYKCGRWHDVAWFEREIAPCDPQPAAPVPLSALPQETVRRVLGMF